MMSALDSAMIERVKAEKKKRRSSSPDAYEDRPRLALIVQSFNRISNISQLVDGIRRLGNHELVVCEDGSLDGSHEAWMSHLTRPNDFLIHSNDLHEIRILDRAIRFTRADIVCLVQDDDLIPQDADWLNAALAQFVTDPKLAIVGGFMGFDSFDPDPAKAKRIWGGSQFRYVHHVNIGPYFIRRDSYEALGGWEYSFSEVGEPGIGYDNELCLRAWLNGYHVGYHFVPFKGPVGHYPANGGTVLFSNDVRVRNSVRNSATIFRTYGPHAEQIDDLVGAANARLQPSVPDAVYESIP